MSAPPAPKRFAIARAPHLCLEVRDEAVYWALAKATRAGMRPVDWGRIDLDEAARGDRDAFLAALAASGAGGYADVEIALRSPRLATERLDLPPLSRAEARAVAARRLGELAARIDADTASAFSVASGRDGALHAWLTAVPRIESAACHATWQDRGFPLTRIQSRHLALGQLVHHLDHEFAEGELVAIFDLEAKSGTCVVADRAGWVFSREVPLRFMGRSVHARTEPEVEGRPHAVEPSSELRLAPLDGDDDAPSGLELATPLGASSAHTSDGGDERDGALAEVAMQTERLATELRRTFRYVQGQLDARPVARVFLSGEITELVDLAPGLASHLDMPVEVVVHRARERAPGRAFATGAARPVGGAAVALGMALAADARGGNLLPHDVLDQIAARRARRALRRGLAAAATVLALLGGALGARATWLAREVDRLDASWNDAQAERATLAVMREARRRAAALASARAAIDRPAPSVASLLHVLAHTVPDDAAVHTLAVEREEDAWRVELAVEAGGASVSSAAQSIADLARAIGEAPFARVDEVARETAPRASQADAQHVRFRVEGALAPVEPGAISAARAAAADGVAREPGVDDA